MSSSNTETLNRFGKLRLTPRHGRLDRAGYYRVSDYEIVTGWVAGFEPPRLPSETAGDPRSGFERALLPALRRSPCVVAFSGGRDSSAILAVATHLARREGLPDPLPATHDFADESHADERTYQEAVIRELGLREWERFRNPDVCDLLGQGARRGLARHGLLWPATLHSTEPMIALAAGGGSLVTGQGGDEVLGPHRLTGLSRLLTSRSGRRRSLRALVDELRPLPLRRRGMLRTLGSSGDPFSYLPPDLAAEATRRIAHERVAMPLRWDHAVLRLAHSRAATASAKNFQRLCAEAGVTYHEPLRDPEFLGPLTKAGGRLGWASRTELMRSLFADVLPDSVCARKDKAEFGRYIIGETTRSFLTTWQGEGIDREVVDTAAFRALATAATPPSRVMLLIQAVWLAIQADARGDRPGRRNGGSA